MTDKSKKVLIVDDSPEDIQFVVENLKEEYAVLVGTSGQKGLEIAANNPRPDVILLDVMMPEMDGYETCRRLKKDPNTQDIDVIFISAQDTTEEKLAGYDVGGSDYLIKPVQPDELLRKVELAIQNKQTHDATVSEKSMAMETAMTAMTSAGEQGVVLEFLRHCSSVNSIEELARMIVEANKQYELKSTVQLRSSQGEISRGIREPVPPLEQELLSSLKDDGRIISHASRAIFNFGNISLLIKDMPEDSDKCGRLRDHIAIILEGAEAKLAELELGVRLAQLVVDSNKAMQEVELEQRSHKESGQKIMDDMLLELEGSFHSWGLTDEQEAVLMNIVQTGVEKSLQHLDQGFLIDEKMGTIIKRLTQVHQ